MITITALLHGIQCMGCPNITPYTARDMGGSRLVSSDWNHITSAAVDALDTSDLSGNVSEITEDEDQETAED